MEYSLKKNSNSRKKLLWHKFYSVDISHCRMKLNFTSKNEMTLFNFKWNLLCTVVLSMSAPHRAICGCVVGRGCQFFIAHGFYIVLWILCVVPFVDTWNAIFTKFHKVFRLYGNDEAMYSKFMVVLWPFSFRFSITFMLYSGHHLMGSQLMGSLG